MWLLVTNTAQHCLELPSYSKVTGTNPMDTRNVGAIILHRYVAVLTCRRLQIMGFVSIGKAYLAVLDFINCAAFYIRYSNLIIILPALVNRLANKDICLGKTLHVVIVLDFLPVFAG